MLQFRQLLAQHANFLLSANQFFFHEFVGQILSDVYVLSERIRNNLTYFEPNGQATSIDQSYTVGNVGYDMLFVTQKVQNLLELYLQIFRHGQEGTAAVVEQIAVGEGLAVERKTRQFEGGQSRVDFEIRIQSGVSVIAVVVYSRNGRNIGHLRGQLSKGRQFGRLGHFEFLLYNQSAHLTILLL